jgi:hypothetical protein
VVRLRSLVQKLCDACAALRRHDRRRLDSSPMRTNWFVAALVVMVASIVIAVIAMRLS